MPACAEPNCCVSASSSKKDSTLIGCSNPACKSQFHLKCINWHAKSTEELQALAFICNSCHHFLSFLGNIIEEKIDSAFGKIISKLDNLKESISAVGRRVDAIENNCTKLNERVTALETAQVSNTHINQTLSITALEDKLANLENKVDASLARADKISCEPPSSYVKKDLTPSSKSNPELKYQILISGMPEAECPDKLQRIERDANLVHDMTNFLSLNKPPIREVHRVGKFNNNSQRTRHLIVTFQSVWEVNKILAAASNLKNYKHKIFVRRVLTEAERTIEKKILRKRWELIQSGINRADLKIKNLKLYQEGSEVSIESCT